MSTKERVKQEIDRMPEELVEEVLKFIENYLEKKKERRFVHTYKLKGSYDNINIRKKAYE